MIRKNSERETEVRENMRDGAGKVTIRHYLKKDQINAKCRLCAELVLPPGAGIGLHEHKEEDEVYIIQKGRGMVEDNGQEKEVGEGDAILTGKGAAHSIRNTGNEDLKVTAVIMQY